MQQKWYALHVRSRQEKVVDTVLTQKGYETFLPLYRVERRWASARRWVELPIFPCYLFSRFDAAKRLPVIATPGVLSIAGFGSQPVPVDEAEIDAIKAIVAAGLPAKPAEPLHAGDRVRLEDGPLKGVSGILVRTVSGARIIVSVTLLQRAVSVELDRHSVRLLERVTPRLSPAPAGSLAF